jgi:hypothetical protein
VGPGQGRYWFAPRPWSVRHGYPVLVFDTRDHISLPLTLFAREALRGKALGTAHAYLYAILPFGSAALNRDQAAIASGDGWSRLGGRPRRRGATQADKGTRYQSSSRRVQG